MPSASGSTAAPFESVAEALVVCVAEALVLCVAEALGAGAADVSAAHAPISRRQARAARHRGKSTEHAWHLKGCWEIGVAIDKCPPAKVPVGPDSVLDSSKIFIDMGRRFIPKVLVFLEVASSSRVSSCCR